MQHQRKAALTLERPVQTVIPALAPLCTYLILIRVELKNNYL